jgi:hypothetical protein
LSSPTWSKSLAAALAVAVVACGVVFRDPLIAWFVGRGGTDVAEAAHYTCSMDPSVRAHAPGQCPICGMALTPVTEQQRGSDLVHVDAASMQRVGVRLAEAGEKTLRRRIVAVGTVAATAASPGAGATAWIDAHVDPVGASDAGEMTVGRPVAVELPLLPLTRFSGAIEQARPDPASGDVSLRVAVQDPGTNMRPGMHAEVEIHVDLPGRLVVPARAVVVAGKRRLVFIDRGKGLFEPRVVMTGAEAAGQVEILEGLEAGQRVVVQGTFLLAAENRIRSNGALWSDLEVKP